MRAPVSLTADNLYFHRTISETPNEEYNLHCHPYYEVFLFLSGEVSYRVEGVKYALTPGSVLLMRPGVFHGVHILTSHPYDRVAVHFLPDLLTPQSAPVLLSPFRAHGACLSTKSTSIAEYFDSILCCADMPQTLMTVSLRPRVEALMSQLCVMAQSVSHLNPVEQDQEPVRAIIEYLGERLAEPLSLEDLSNRFFISKNQLNRVFRQATGTTVGNYISHKRIALAQQLMLKGIPASEAALRVGFGDYSSFYRAYRRLNGSSPASLQKLLTKHMS